MFTWFGFGSKIAEYAVYIKHDDKVKGNENHVDPVVESKQEVHFGSHSFDGRSNDQDLEYNDYKVDGNYHK